jgi:hypothetical protein
MEGPFVVVVWFAVYGAGALHTDPCASPRTSGLPGEGARVRSTAVYRQVA